MTKNSKARKPDTFIDRAGRERKTHNARPSDRGLGPGGGGWNLRQASEWSGVGEATLRKMAKRGEIPVVKVGRRFLIPRQGFMDWFNRSTTAA